MGVLRQILILFSLCIAVESWASNYYACQCNLIRSNATTAVATAHVRACIPLGLNSSLTPAAAQGLCEVKCSSSHFAKVCELMGTTPHRRVWHESFDGGEPRADAIEKPRVTYGPEGAGNCGVPLQLRYSYGLGTENQIIGHGWNHPCLDASSSTSEQRDLIGQYEEMTEEQLDATLAQEHLTQNPPPPTPTPPPRYTQWEADVLGAIRLLEAGHQCSPDSIEGDDYAYLEELSKQVQAVVRRQLGPDLGTRRARTIAQEMSRDELLALLNIAGSSSWVQDVYDKRFDRERAERIERQRRRAAREAAERERSRQQGFNTLASKLSRLASNQGGKVVEDLFRSHSTLSNNTNTLRNRFQNMMTLELGATELDGITPQRIGHSPNPQNKTLGQLRRQALISIIQRGIEYYAGLSGRARRNFARTVHETSPDFHKTMLIYLRAHPHEGINSHSLTTFEGQARGADGDNLLAE